MLLVHSPGQELAFMKDGYGLNRRSFASNSFIIVGPESDPFSLKSMTPAGLYHDQAERNQQDSRRLICLPG